jgi:hypothetical protein
MSQADLFPLVETTTLLENIQRLIHQFKTPRMTSKIILPGPRKFGRVPTAHTI